MNPSPITAMLVRTQASSVRSFARWSRVRLGDGVSCFGSSGAPIDILSICLGALALERALDKRTDARDVGAQFVGYRKAVSEEGGIGIAHEDAINAILPHQRP